MKKRMLALCFMLIFGAICVASALGIALMWRSTTFIPVYVQGQYIRANRIVRTIVYVVLVVISFLSFWATIYYSDKVTAKRHRRNKK